MTPQRLKQVLRHRIWSAEALASAWISRCSETRKQSFRLWNGLGVREASLPRDSATLRHPGGSWRFGTPNFGLVRLRRSFTRCLEEIAVAHGVVEMAAEVFLGIAEKRDKHQGQVVGLRPAFEAQSSHQVA